MKTIKQSYKIKSSIDKVWKALIDPKEVSSWSGSPAKMNDKVNAKFELWGGSIWGKNIEVIKNKKIVQEWFSEDEIVDEPSIVTITLKEDKNETVLDLIQENVPEKFVSNISNGWKEYYLGPLKDYLEK